MCMCFACLKALVAHLHRQTAQNVSACRDVLTWFGSASTSVMLIVSNTFLPRSSVSSIIFV
jgi:hypothetical protein